MRRFKLYRPGQNRNGNGSLVFSSTYTASTPDKAVEEASRLASLFPIGAYVVVTEDNEPDHVWLFRIEEPKPAVRVVPVA